MSFNFALRSSNLILVLVYLLSGTVLSGYGRVSFCAENRISDKPSVPKQHLLTNQRLQKHLAPNLNFESAPDLISNPSHDYYQPLVITPFTGAESVAYVSRDCLQKLSNKAPPQA